MTLLRSLQIGRFLIGSPMDWQEAMGDPNANIGGAVVAGVRAVQASSVTLATYAADGEPARLADYQRIRRQIRGLLNNGPLKYAGFLYVIANDDPEINGWYVPEPAQMTRLDAQAWRASGLWQVQMNMDLAGHRRTHREARQAWVKDLLSGRYPRDIREMVYSTDFGVPDTMLSGIVLCYLPNGAINISDTVNGSAYQGRLLRADSDAGQTLLVPALSDLMVVAFDREESSMNVGDVRVYDRRGTLNFTQYVPDASWEEAYGGDHDWSWLANGQPQDCPVLDNGLIRVRYDASESSLPAFIVDVWTSAGLFIPQWVEQGRIQITRLGDVFATDDTWVAASLKEYTPDRAVIQVVLNVSQDPLSRETVFITLQRGWSSVRVEVYPAMRAGNLQAGADVEYYFARTPQGFTTTLGFDETDSVMRTVLDGTSAFTGTAGLSSDLLPFGQLGPANFLACENFVSVLRCPSFFDVVSQFQVTMAVVLESNTSATGWDLLNNRIASSGFGGYCRVDIGFTPTTSDQVIEAEVIRNASSPSTFQQLNGTASGDLEVGENQSGVVSHHTLQKIATNLIQVGYRCFARVRSDPFVNGQFQAYFHNSPLGYYTFPLVPSIVGNAWTTWQWIDFGELYAISPGPGFYLDGLVTGGGGNIYVDRVEFFLLTDQARDQALATGSRDLGQSLLYDVRMLGALVAR